MLPDAAREAGGAVLDALGKPAAYVRHLERTVMDVNWARGASWDDLRDSYNRTKHGEQSFDRGLLASIQQDTDPEIFDLAKKVASGRNPNDILKAVRDEQGVEAAARVYGLLQDNEDFKTALTRVNAAHLSVGREIAHGLGFDSTSEWFNRVSGTFDALNSVLADPLIVGGKFQAGRKVAKWGLDAASGEQRVRQLLTLDKGAMDYWQRVADHVNVITNTTDKQAAAAPFGALRAQHAQILPMVSDLVAYKKAENIGDMTLNHVKDFLTGAVGYQQLLMGNPAERVALIPRNNWTQRRLNALRDKDGVLSKVIDWRTEGHKLNLDTLGDITGADPSTIPELAKTLDGYRQTFRGRAALAMTRFSTAVPDLPSGALDLTAKDAAEQVYRMARFYGPKFWANSVAAAFTAANIEGRRQIVRGVIHTMGEVAGVDKRWLDDYVDNGLGGRTARYTANGEDMLEDGRHVAVLESDARDYVHVPSFRDMVASASKHSTLEKAYGPLNHKAIDSYTDQWFKPGVLLRPALAVRNAGEEIYSHFVRNGIKSYVKGRLAARVTDPDAGRMYRALTRHLPGQITDWTDVLHLTHQEKLRIAGRKLLTDEENRYLREAVEDKYLRQVMSRDVFENLDRSTRMTSDEAMNVIRARDTNGSVKTVQLKMSGKYGTYSSDGLDGAVRWAHQLEKLADSELGEIAMLHVDDEATAMRHLIDKIESPEFASHRAGMEIYREKGAHGWAQAVHSHAKFMLSTGDGQLNHEVVGLLRKTGEDGKAFIDREAINAADLNKIDSAARPRHVVGRETVMVSSMDGFIQQAVQHGFNGLSELTGWLSRQPIWNANYLAARKEFANYERELTAKLTAQFTAKATGKQVEGAVRRAEAHARRQVVKMAADKASLKTLAFVDNPNVRSQASVLTRNVIPFYRAQEEFYRRWARTFAHSPETIRKAQLTMGGLEHSGFVHEDADGNKYFVYPGTSWMAAAIQKVSEALGVDLVHVPVPMPMRSQVKFLNQGLDPKNVLPSTSSLFAFPLKAAAQIFPELDPVKTRLLGPSADKSWLVNMLPTPIARAYRIAKPDSDQLLSAMKQAATYLEAAGLTPPADATPEERDRFQERVKNTARSILWLRFAYGLAAPASPQGGDLAPKNGEAFKMHDLETVSDEFHALVGKLGFDDALTVFLAKHPDQAPWTVSSSKGIAGAYVPATEKAGEFIDAHKALFKQFPAVAAFLLPQDDGKFDMNTYLTELATGLRTKTNFEQHYRNLKISGKLGVYFDSKDAHLAKQEELKAAGDVEGRRAEAAAYKEWKDSFLQANPLLNEYLTEGKTRQLDRENVVDQLRRALDSNLLPDGEAKQGFADVLQAWDAHQKFQAEHNGRDAESTALRAKENEGFDSYMKQLAAANPNVAGLYNKVFRWMGN